MGDIYTESVIPIDTKPIFKIAKWIIYICLGICIVLSFLGHALFLIAILFLSLMLNIVLGKTDAEYEYVHTNDIFDIDLIVANSKRKQLLTINTNQIELIAPWDSPLAKRFQNAHTVDYSGSLDRRACYAMIYWHEGKRRKVLLSLDANMLSSLKLFISDHVIETIC